MTRALRRAVEEARSRLAPTYSREAFRSLHEAERRLAASLGEPWAEPLPLSVQWDAGAPLPHVISNGHRTAVLCYASDVPPDWDGTTVESVSVSNRPAATVLIFTFEGCQSTRFGGPNDEALPGHPLSSRGLDGYQAHLVHNSAWIKEEESINAVHPHHRGDWSDRLSHYFFVFHDDMFEALAQSVTVATEAGDLASALLRVASSFAED